MKIPRMKLLKGDHFVEHLFVKAMIETFGNGEEFKEALKKIKWEEKEEVDVKFTVEGVELDLFKVCKEWEKQVDRLVAEQAVEIVKEKFNKVSGFLYDLEKEMRKKVKEELGVELDDYDY